MKTRQQIILLLLFPFMAELLQAQAVLYPQHFALSEVTLLDSPFKTAMERNFQTLLSYDHHRLLTPYIRQAGLSTGDYAQWKSLHPSFPNWGGGRLQSRWSCWRPLPHGTLPGLCCLPRSSNQNGPQTAH